jgi:hypothetical protein
VHGVLILRVDGGVAGFAGGIFERVLGRDESTQSQHKSDDVTHRKSFEDENKKRIVVKLCANTFDIHQGYALLKCNPTTPTLIKAIEQTLSIVTGSLKM